MFSSKAIPSPVGVYFYDGGHTFREQYRALRNVEPFLADEALPPDLKRAQAQKQAAE